MSSGTCNPLPGRSDGSADGMAFWLEENESGLSVNWIEFFSRNDKQKAINEIRNHIQRRLGGQSIFAELNIEAIKIRLLNEGLTIRVTRRPLPPIADYKEDPSHCEISGLPPQGSPDQELIGDIIAECVTETHPSRSPS